MSETVKKLLIENDFEFNSPYKLSGSLLNLLTHLYYNIGILQAKTVPNKPDYQRILDLRNWKL